MAATNLQKWIRFMKNNAPDDAALPASSSGDEGKVLKVGPEGRPQWGFGLPEISESDKNKVLVVDSNGEPTWGVTAALEIPLGANETIGIFKD